MGRFLLETAKVVGTATEKSWSQVHLFSPADEKKQKQRGELLAVLSLKGLGEGVEAVAAGREIISRLHEEYYGNLEGKALGRLGTAVKRVFTEAAAEAEIEIVAAAVMEGVLYLAIAGKGQVVLQRDSKMGVLLQGNEGVTTASGYLEGGDLFLLGTAGFFQAVAVGVLKAALATGSPAEATEAVAPIIHGRPESGTVAAVVSKVKEEEKKETAILTPPEKEERITSEPAEVPTPSKLTAKVGETVKPTLAGFKQKAKQWTSRLSLGLQDRLGEKTIYLKRGVRERGEKPERPKKTVFTVVLVLLLLLGISVALGARQRGRLGVEKKTAPLFQQARQKKEEGEALLELNPIRARELLLETQSLSQQIESEGLKTAEFEKFKEELNQVLNQVFKEHQVEAAVFFDLELIKQEARGDDLAVSGGKIMVLDKGKTGVYEIGIVDQKQAILAGGKSLEGASHVAAFLPKIFILTDEGIVEVDKLTKKERLVIETDEEWGEIVDLRAFGGNLYLLDKKGTIWQYPAIETGFGARRRWLKGELEPDFSDALAMAIDGSIWTLKANGTIWKFTRGVKDAFGVAGLEPFANPTTFYTDDDCENLYILDKGNSQVVVLAKSGEYKATYIWEGVKDVDALIASEEEKKILLLKGSKIYEIGIK